MSLSAIIGISFGIISAVKQYSALDHICVVTALVFACIPGFWLGLMLMMLFSLKLGWLPSYGAESLKNFILPTLTVSMTSAAGLLRLTRSAMLETIRQEYIRTAKAKGASKKRIIIKHALRNALMRRYDIGNELRCVSWRRNHCGNCICHAGYGYFDHNGNQAKGHSYGHGFDSVSGSIVQPDYFAGRYFVCGDRPKNHG